MFIKRKHSSICRNTIYYNPLSQEKTISGKNHPVGISNQQTPLQAS